MASVRFRPIDPASSPLASSKSPFCGNDVIGITGLNRPIHIDGANEQLDDSAAPCTTSVTTNCALTVQQCTTRKRCHSTTSASATAAAAAPAAGAGNASASGGGSDWRAGKRRRRGAFVPRTKFLLGGSSSDPLNLGSLTDEQATRQITPVCSPMPTPRYRKERLQVIIPHDISDPLGLNEPASAPCSHSHCTSLDTQQQQQQQQLLLTTSASSAAVTTTVPSAAADAADAAAATATEESALLDVTSLMTQLKRRKVVSAPGASWGPRIGGATVTRQHSAPALTGAPCSADDGASCVDRRCSMDCVAAIGGADGLTRLLHSVSSSVEPQTLATHTAAATATTCTLDHTPTTTDNNLIETSAVVTPAAVQVSCASHSCSSVVPGAGQHSNASQSVADCGAVRTAAQRHVFQYGNYNRYYGYRNPTEADPRLRLLKRQWLTGRDVLDIGCNVGHVTLCVARDYAPRRCVGLDIDASLVKAARKNIRRYQRCAEFPSSMNSLYGQMAPLGPVSGALHYPGNVSFVHANFVLSSDAQLETVRPEFDFVICLSVTKWIHLNFGDAGLRRFFRRAFLCLRPGGRLLLEPQPWASYVKKKKITPRIWENFQKIRLRPDLFPDLLVSEIGFSHYEPLGRPHHNNKGFNRQLQLYIKAGEQTDVDPSPATPSPFPVPDSGAADTHPGATVQPAGDDASV